MYTVAEANKYLASKIIKESKYRPLYHFTADFGWINDPHGIVKLNDEYHIYFQYYPFDTSNPCTCWGHTTTKDFIHFSKVDCVIAPDSSYDMLGCWSGSLILKNETIYLYYTGYSRNEKGEERQTICLATSKDGINFKKYKGNPIITESKIPLEASKIDFRDPCIFIKNDTYYLLAGSKNIETKKALLLLYKSNDLYNFEFDHFVFEESKFGTMFECPNIIQFKDMNYFVLSPQNILPRNDSFFNVSSNIYFKCDDRFIKERIKLDSVKEIDHGLEFYATNIFDDEKIAISWLEMWGRRYYLNEIKEDFINSFSLAKKISQLNGKLAFKPLNIYDEYFTKKDSFAGKIDKNNPLLKEINLSSKLNISLKEIKNKLIEIQLFKKEDEYVRLLIDTNKHRLTLDRSKLKIQLGGVDPSSSKDGIRYLSLSKNLELLDLVIYIDRISCEIFLDDFRDSISFLSFNLGNKMLIKSEESIICSLEICDFIDNKKTGRTKE